LPQQRPDHAITQRQILYLRIHRMTFIFMREGFCTPEMCHRDSQIIRQQFKLW
jgi:hypothetical protein